jgi:hypothetical protein
MLGVRTMEAENHNSLKVPVEFFNSIPPPKPFPNIEDDEWHFPPISYDEMTILQRLGYSHLHETSLTVSHLHTLITVGILPRLSRTGPRELHILSFLKMVFFFFKKFKRVGFFFDIKMQWRRVVLSIFRLSKYKCQEIGFDSQLPLIMQNFGKCNDLRKTPYEWATKSQLYWLDPFLVRFAFETAIRNVVLPACRGELNLSEYDFWMLLRIFKHLLCEIQNSSSIHLIRVKYHGSLEFCFSSRLDDKEQAACDECETAIRRTQELLEYIAKFIRSQEFSNGQHHLIAKLLASM